MPRRGRTALAPDACAAAHALNLVGDRWALLVVRELLLGPKRFTDLRSGLPGISPNVLTTRLEELERSGIVRRRRLDPPANASVYELTEWGLDLEPVIVALGRWAVRSPFRPQGNLNTDSIILSFRTMFDPKTAGDFSATLELRFGADRFRAVVHDGAFTVERGHATDPDAVIEGDAAAIASVAYGGRKLADAIASGDLRVTGNKAAAKRFLSLFPLPEPAAVSPASV